MYCDQIHSSSYLMGPSFHLSLFWALKEKTIHRVQRGDFGVKPKNEVPPCEKEARYHAQNHIENVQESELCKKIRYDILRVLGAYTYLSWFLNLTFEEDDDILRIHTPSSFAKDYIQQHFSPLFQNVHRDVCFCVKTPDLS
jgi:hypothetical protein